MQIVTVVFDHPDRQWFEPLYQVFAKSIRHHMPDVKLITERPSANPRSVAHIRNATDNTQKLEVWNHYMQTATEDTIFADCDMLMVRPADRAFDEPFDIGITYRMQRGNIGGFPMNGGIVFARPTDGAREFFRLWVAINLQMLRNDNLHVRWQNRYGGMNQAAFGLIEQELGFPCSVAKFDTRQWNAVDSDWGFIDGATVFVHIKSILRSRLLARHEPCSDMQKAMRAWYAEEGRLI